MPQENRITTAPRREGFFSSLLNLILRVTGSDWTTVGHAFIEFLRKRHEEGSKSTTAITCYGEVFRYQYDSVALASVDYGDLDKLRNVIPRLID